MKTNPVAGSSRARSSPAVKSPELQKLRVQTWYRHLLERAVGSEVERYSDIAATRAAIGVDNALPNLNAALQKWLNMQVEQNLHRLTLEEAEAAQRLSRSRYDEGNSTPTELTISVFEVLLPGSAAVYDLGPGYLPVWQVVDGDLKACKAYVQEMLNPSSQRWEGGFNELVQEVFDALIAPAYRLKMDEIPVLGAPQRDTHPVWLSYINSRYAATFGDDEADKLPEAFTLDDAILLAIGLAHLATEREGSPKLQLEWLLVGLCWGVIGQHIDEHLQEYVLRSVQERGKAMDVALRKMGIRLPTFEERWPTGITP
ncbi:hypothetical protein [Variovorax paradoxus]|uniref:hypothetical protein n=1 Tax=Variovorax paradoxus TaxID=34073 RepID=UPI0012D483B7|nr:hypothetical protein [Variovorax paradoxus]